MLSSVILMLFQTNHTILTRTVAGLTHADSLLQPSFQANCLNWVLGHILTSRNRILRLLDAEPALPPEHLAQYNRGSAPLTPDSPVMQLADLLAAYERSQVLLEAALGQVSAEKLASNYSADTTFGGMITFLAWHEGYHIGQTDLLRQLAGKNDQVIP